jgi:hypothetical protein
MRYFIFETSTDQVMNTWHHAASTLMAESTDSKSRIASNLLDGAIIALTTVKAGVTGLGVPGVEPAINGVLQIAVMISVRSSLILGSVLTIFLRR